MENTKENISINKLYEDFVDDSRYNVYLLNDKDTWYEFVVLVLVTVFGYSEEQADDKTREIHRKGPGGRGLVATLPLEAAYEKIDQVDMLNLVFDFLLQTEIEKA